VIHKLTIRPDQILTVVGTPVHVNTQHGEWRVWYIVNDAAYEVIVVGTGHDTNTDGWEYINTFIEAGGSLVWHAFRRRVAQ
jgi:hypothetical protein